MNAFSVRALSGIKAAKLSMPEQILLGLSLMAISTWVFPHSAVAQSVSTTNSTFTFEINAKIKNLEDSVNDSMMDTADQKLLILKDYLAKKNSPLQAHAEVLLKQPNWKLILSISHAESNMCKHQLGNNCWGIGGAKYHRFYPTFSEGIVDANNLIQKYNDSGLDTPKKMMRRWVGWNNQNWVIANNQVLAQLEELGI